MNKQQPLLQINNLSLAYGAKEILKSVQLTVLPGRDPGHRRQLRRRQKHSIKNADRPFTC